MGLGSFIKNSTMFTKIAIGAILVAGIYFGQKYLKKTGTIDKLATSTKVAKMEISEDADLVIAYNTFPGMEGLLYMNGGMEPNADSKIFKDYGLKVQIKQMDVVADTRDGLKAGVLDLVYCTTDALPIEMSSGSQLLNQQVKEIMKVNESRGADAIVATAGIKKVTDLKGKKIAYAVGTASNTLLINVLETSGLTVSDVESYKVADGVEAANAFKNGQCDAAVVWAPDDEDCVAAIKGAAILITTKTATQIIADGLLVSAATLEKKKDAIIKLVKAWLEGNAELASNPNAKKVANKLFALGFNFPEDIAAKSADKIRFSTLGDNKQFFGFDATYTGVTGEKMYGRMSVKYTDLGLAKSPAAWRQVSDGSVIEAILGDASFASKPGQAAEGAAVFTPPTEEDKTVEAQSSKVVTLTFPTAGFTLDEQDKTLIDREVTGLAQAFAGARIRVEGNTDNVGDKNMNRALSLKRANSVIAYLISEYKFDKNKFIIVGNGPDKPVEGCEGNQDDACKQKNRRTDFQFIW